ncbi:hypothetical protein [Micromonospora sp. B9E7]|uniref:hypothetical protein n=1 Tax=Micromonospora sp. B9E7 TaxID=3153574 RepID=UPI00325EA70B
MPTRPNGAERIRLVIVGGRNVEVTRRWTVPPLVLHSRPCRHSWSNIVAALPRLTVLLCDSDNAAAGRLYQELASSPLVERVVAVESLADAVRETGEGQFDVIIVDPLSTDLAQAGRFVLSQTGEGTAAVLYVDLARVEEQAVTFYHGDRNRLRETFTLDKRTPPGMLAAEADVVLTNCQAFRLLATGRSRADRLIGEVRDRATSTGDNELGRLVEDVDQVRILEHVRPDPGLVRPKIASNSVFLSYRFKEEDGYVRGLSGLLEDHGFTVITGRAADGYVGMAVLNRIRECEFFVSLMTRARQFVEPGEKFATSAWLIEEKGAALAFSKYMVLLVEEGVDDIGGLHGDWQRHQFTAPTFTTAARAAVQQLRNRSGRSE